MADLTGQIQAALAMDQAGRTGPAIAALTRLCKRKNAPAAAHHFLGMLLAKTGASDQALYHLDRAQSLEPSRVQFLVNHANVLAQFGSFDRAIELYQRAIQLENNHVQAHIGLAAGLLHIGQLIEAQRVARRACDLAPKHSQACVNLASALIVTGHAARACVVLEEALSTSPNDLQLLVLLAAAMHYDRSQAKRTNLEVHIQLGKVARGLALREKLPIATADALLAQHADHTKAGEPLHIGFLCADARDHPVGAFLEVLFEPTDTITLSCFDVGTRRDESSRAYQARAKAKGVQWFDAGSVSNAQLIDMVREARVDVLVETSGWTLGHRQIALAARMAPLQVTFLGYPSTTGNRSIDVRLVDAFSDPPGSEDQCSEALIRLSPCAWCYQLPADISIPSQPGTRRQPVTPDSPVVFGSFNNLAKTTPVVLETFAELLKAVPHAQLVLKNAAFVDPKVREQVASSLTSHGIDAARFTLFEPTQDHASHLALYHNIDIALDTFPYAGTTTTCEALAMGVPVVTCAGDCHAARVGVSLLHAVGLGTQAGEDSLIATDREDFLRRAARLAKDRTRLATLHASLAGQVKDSILMNAQAYRRSFYNALQSLWHQQRNDSPGRGA